MDRRYGKSLVLLKLQRKSGEGNCVWLIHTLSTGVCITTQGVARGSHGVEVKSMIDLVLVKKDMLRYVQV